MGQIPDSAMLYDIRRRSLYLSLLNTSDSLAQNIDRLFFADGAHLKGEFDELYNALFSNADTYISIVKLLSENKSGLTRRT